MLLVIDFQERLIPHIHNHEAMIRNAAAMIRGCRILDIPIVAVQQYTKGLGETDAALREALGEYSHVEKMTFSACGNDEFMAALPGKDTRLYVTGIEAHICVQQTVLGLLERGYGVTVLADCIGSRKENDFLYAVRRMETAGAVVTTMESALFGFMDRADHPKRKDISNLVR